MGDYTVETALRRFRETTEDEGTTDIPRPMLDGLVAFGYLTRRRAGPHGYVYKETVKATALLARQEGEDARDAARYRWLKENFQADYCRSTSDYWRITGEHETPQELHIGNGELTLDYLVDAARSGGGD